LSSSSEDEEGEEEKNETEIEAGSEEDTDNDDDDDDDVDDKVPTTSTRRSKGRCISDNMSAIACSTEKFISFSKSIEITIGIDDNGKEIQRRICARFIKFIAGCVSKNFIQRLIC